MSASYDAPPLRRIAITGVGLVTPLGVDRESSWQGLLAGRRAVQWLDEIDVKGFQPKFPGEPRLFGARVPLEIPGSDRMVTFAKLAAREAVRHAGISPAELRDAICVIGTSKIDLQQVDHWLDPVTSEMQQALFTDVFFPSQAASAVAEELGCEGGAHSPVAACATGLLSLIQTANLIRSGQCHVALGGAADSSLHRGVLASYRRLGVLARPGNDPGTCCRPFDAARTGFAVGEGAAVLVLEDWEHARARGASILAEWEDGLTSSESFDLIRTDRHGSALARLIQRLLNRRGISPEEIDAVSLHGTGTILNDLSEGAALRTVLGARHRPIDVFGLKGAIGHLMGAAGAVETAACILGLARGRSLPTVNHQKWEEVFDKRPLRFNFCRSDTYRRMLKISLGFGGTLAAALVKSSS